MACSVITLHEKCKSLKCISNSKNTAHKSSYIPPVLEEVKSPPDKIFDKSPSSVQYCSIDAYASVACVSFLAAGVRDRS